MFILPRLFRRRDHPAFRPRYKESQFTVEWCETTLIQDSHRS